MTTPQDKKSRLTLEQCRKVDPKLKALSDEELSEVRDDLYELAQLALDQVRLETKKESKKNPRD
jgi:hypothetical protein